MEMLNLGGCERWGRGSSVTEGAGVGARAFSSLARAGVEGAVTASSAGLSIGASFASPAAPAAMIFQSGAAWIWQRWVSTVLV